MSRKQVSAQADKIKKRFIELLGEFKGDKKRAAQEVGADLVEIRSWRHKDELFNEEYKKLVIGSDQAKERTHLKEPFLELLKKGRSQRAACDDLRISVITLRTWKKVDDEFKRACNAVRTKTQRR